MREQEIDPIAFEAMMSLHWNKPPRDVYCQVYEDGYQRWSSEPTDAERIDVANVLKDRPGFRGIITLER
jgi:hypothetical protein